MDHTVLPATHMFIHEWNKSSCLYSVFTRERHPSEIAHIRLQLTTYLSTSKG